MPVLALFTTSFNIQEFQFLATDCTCKFYMVSRKNSNYFSIQNSVLIVITEREFVYGAG